MSWDHHRHSARWFRGSRPAAEAGGEGQYLMGADGGIQYVQLGPGRRSAGLWTWLAWLSLCWGAVHAVVGAVIFTIIWATATLPRGLAFAVAIVLLLVRP